VTSTGKLKVHFGTANASAEDYYYIQIDNATASALGVGNSSAAQEARMLDTASRPSRARSRPWKP
jgi:flagellin